MILSLLIKLFDLICFICYVNYHFVFSTLFRDNHVLCVQHIFTEVTFSSKSVIHFRKDKMVKFMRINFHLIPTIFNEKNPFWNLTIKIKMFQLILWHERTWHVRHWIWPESPKYPKLSLRILVLQKMEKKKKQNGLRRVDIHNLV